MLIQTKRGDTSGQWHRSHETKIIAPGADSSFAASLFGPSAGQLFVLSTRSCVIWKRAGSGFFDRSMLKSEINVS